MLQDELITKFDDRLENYQSFFDKEWAEELYSITDNTNGLTFQWWSVSQARSLPWFICQYGCEYEKGFIENLDVLIVHAIKQNELEKCQDDLKKAGMLVQNQGYEQKVVLARHTNDAFDLLKKEFSFLQRDWSVPPQVER